MALANVAAVGIKVRPDTKGFSEDLGKKLRKAERGNQLAVPIRPDARGMAEKLRGIRNDIQENINKGALKLYIPVQPVGDIATAAIRGIVKDAHKRAVAGDIHLEIPLGIDSTKLAQELKAAVRKAQHDLGDDLKINVEVNLQARKVKDDWRRLKKDLSGDKIDLKADLDKQSKVRAQIAELTRNRYLDVVVRINKRSMAIAKASLDSLFGLNVLTSAGRMVEHFATNIDSYAGSFAKMAMKLSTVGSVVLATVSSLTGIGASLSALGGYLLALPTAAIGVGAFIATIVASFHGFKSAIDGDVASLKALPAEARNAALALRGVWGQIQKPTQQAFWSQMSGAFEGLVKYTLPEFISGMALVGTQTGRFTAQLLRAFTEQGGSGIFQTMFGYLAQGIQNANLGVRPLMAAIITLGSVGSKFLPKVGQYMADVGKEFAMWVQRSADSGKIEIWLDNASVAAKNLGRVLVETKGILSGLVSGARAGGTGDLGSFADALGNVRDHIQSPTFQLALANLFNGAHTAVQAIKVGLTDLLTTLAFLSPALNNILKISGDVVGKVLSGLAGALRQDGLASGLVNFFEGIRKGVEGFLKYLPSVATGVGKLGAVLGSIAQGFLPVAGQIFGAAADAFSAIASSLQLLIPIFASFSGTSVAMLAQAITLLAIPLNILSTFFAMLPDMVQTAILALGLFYRFVNRSKVPDPTVGARNGLKQLPIDAAQSSKRTSAALNGSVAFADWRAQWKALPGIVRTAMAGSAQAATAGAAAIAPAMQRLGLTNITGGALRTLQRDAHAMGVLRARAFSESYVNALTQETKRRSSSFNAAGLSQSFQMDQNLIGANSASLAKGINESYKAGTNIAAKLNRLGMDRGAVAQGLLAPISNMFKQPIDSKPLSDNMKQMLRTGLADPGIVRQAAAAAGTLSNSFSSALARGFASASSPSIRLSMGAVTGLTSSMTAAGAQASAALIRGFSELRPGALGPVGTSFAAALATPIASSMAGYAPRIGGTFAQQISNAVNSNLKNTRINFQMPAIRMPPPVAATPGQLAAVANATAAGFNNQLTTALRTTNGSAFKGVIARSLADGAGKINLAPAVAASLATMAGPMSSVSALARVAGANIMSNVSSGLSAGARGLSAAVSGLGGMVTSGFKSMFAFIGGGWGAAFMLGFSFISSLTKETEAAKKSAEETTTAYRGMAKALNESGQGGAGDAGVKYATSMLDGIRDTLKTTKVSVWGAFANDDSTTLADNMRKAGITDQDFAQYMTGVADHGMTAFLDEQIAFGRANQGTAVDRWLWGGSDSAANKAYADKLQSYKQQKTDFQNGVGDLWKNDRSGSLSNVTKGLTDLTGGKITLDNIDKFNGKVAEIPAHLSRTDSEAGKSVKDFADLFSNAMGGLPNDVTRYFESIRHSITQFGPDAAKADPAGAMQKIAAGLVKAGAPIAKVKSALQEFGYTVDEQNNVVTFLWGKTVDKFGQGVQVLGAFVPKMTEFSDGSREMAAAISAATGVDASKLQSVISLNGYDPTLLASGLGALGVSYSGVAGVLQSLGITGAPAAEAMAAFNQEMATTARLSFSPQAAEAYALALDAIAKSADDAATKASLLLEAIDKLNGGKISTERLTSGFNADLNNVTGLLDVGAAKIPEIMDKITAHTKLTTAEMEILRKAALTTLKPADAARITGALSTGAKLADADMGMLKTATDGVVASTFDWSSVVDKATGKIDTASASGQDFLGKIDALRSSGAALAEDVFTKVFTATGSITEATLAATAATEGQIKGFRDSAIAAGIPIPVVDELMKHYNLMPSEIVTQLIASTLGATQPIAIVMGLMAEAVKAGSSKPIPLTADQLPALGVLKTLGVQMVAYSDGHYEAQMNADPTAAKAQVDSIQRYLSDANFRAVIDADTRLARNEIKDLDNYQVDVTVVAKVVMPQGQFVAKAWADGGVAEYFANGGLLRGMSAVSAQMKSFANGSENHIAQIAPAGSWRVWAEPETGGEAYIPLSPAKRGRSLAILDSVADQFGYDLVAKGQKSARYVDGGINGPVTNTGTGPQINVTNHFPVAEKTSVTIARAAALAGNLGGY